MDTALLKSLESGAVRNEMPGTEARVVCVLPRGETFRNFIYTGALDQVGETADVVLFSVIPSDDLKAELTRRYGRIFPLNHAREAWSVRFLRELLDMAHGRSLWSGAAQERWRLRDSEAVSPAQKVKRVAKKALCYPFSSESGLKRLSKLERSASQRFRTSDQYIDLMRDLKPSLVFNASHVHSEVAIQVVQAAQWMGVPTATFLFSWDNLTSQGRILLPYDYYFAWNEQIRRDLLKMYPAVRSENVFVTGTPQFDFHFRPEFYWSREKFCGHIGADPGRPIVLYTTGMPNHMPGEHLVVEKIADMLSSMHEFGRPQLVVRLYPKDQTGRFDGVRRSRPDILFPEIPWEAAWLTPKYEDSYLLTNMLRHAAVGINVASTVSLELCMFDKPVLNVGYDPPIEVPVPWSRYYTWDHYSPVVASGAVSVAYSPEALREMIVDSLANPGMRRRERAALLQQFFGDTLDGQSSRRVAEQLSRLSGAVNR